MNSAVICDGCAETGGEVRVLRREKTRCPIHTIEKLVLRVIHVFREFAAIAVPCSYNAVMARGWESKAVEDQISARETGLESAAKPVLTPNERARIAKKEGLLLARAHTLNGLESARDERYRQQLERALAHLDSQLSEL